MHKHKSVLYSQEYLIEVIECDTEWQILFMKCQWFSAGNWLMKRMHANEIIINVDLICNGAWLAMSIA